jgi:hypothetical protein
MKYTVLINCVCDNVCTFDIESDAFNIDEIADDFFEQFKNPLIRVKNEDDTISLINTRNIISIDISEKTDTQVVVQSEEGVV